jgi:release factor glutamine methyltransferase
LFFLDDVLKRILKKEPLSKILKQSSFYGRDFYINEHVLDPRPDSECLIDGVLKLFQKNGSHTFLDLGTGSGCLIITLLLEFPHAKGIAVDLSPHALKVAKKNAHNLGVHQRIGFFKSNWFGTLSTKYFSSFDLIISNPPYIKHDYILDDNVALYDPKMALFSGVDGLDDYKIIFSKLDQYLKDDGVFLGEIGFDQSDLICEALKQYKALKFEGFFKDLSNIKRCVIVKKND